MATKKRRNGSSYSGNGSNLKDIGLDHLMKLDELPIEQSMIMLKEAGIDVDEEEAIKSWSFCIYWQGSPSRKYSLPIKSFL